MRIRGVLLAALTVFSACAGKKLNNVGAIGGGAAAAGGNGATSSAGAGATPDGGRGGSKTTPRDGGAGGVTTTPTEGGTGEGGQAPLPSDCGDGIGNGDETDVDCGGKFCPSCHEGQHCNGGEDCESNECGGPYDDFTCEPLHCGNHELDEDEGDVDCGGAECDKCENGQLCQVAQDCHSRACREGVCVQPCQSLNDCGTGAACQDGKCVYCADSDQCIDECSGGTNEAIGAVCACRGGIVICVAPSCDNGVEEADETDVDCGGSQCDPCDDKKGCEVSEDCRSGYCAMKDWGDSTQQCIPTSCNDHVMNGSETDIDCGGPSCPHCEQGKDCVAEDDCEYRFSCREGACVRDCRPNNAQLCGTLGECIDDRCVECDATEDCSINCGLNSAPLCHNRICQCTFSP